MVSAFMWDEEVVKKSEEAAGPDFEKFGYLAARRLSRRLLDFAMNGINSEGRIEAAKEVLQ